MYINDQSHKNTLMAVLGINICGNTTFETKINISIALCQFAKRQTMSNIQDESSSILFLHRFIIKR